MSVSKLINYFTTSQGIFVIAVLTIIGFVLTAIPYINSSEVVPTEVVDKILVQHEKQLLQKDEQLLSQEELNKQLMEVVQFLLEVRKQDSDAKEALEQLQVGDIRKARNYFGKWSKVADKKQAANWARYAGTLDYLNDPEAAVEWYQRALQLNPNSEHSQVLQSLVSKLAASTEVSIQISTGEKSPPIKDTEIKGDLVIK